MCVVMKEDLYFEIIKKQQELINLMLRVGIADNRTIQVDNRLETDVNDMQEIVSNDDKQKIECDLDGFKKWLENKGRSENCIDTYVRGIELFYRKYKCCYRPVDAAAQNNAAYRYKLLHFPDTQLYR